VQVQAQTLEKIKSKTQKQKQTGSRFAEISPRIPGASLLQNSSAEGIGHQINVSTNQRINKYTINQLNHLSPFASSEWYSKKSCTHNSFCE
jgi:hypothetical protein